MEDGPPGEVAEMGFGRLGLVTDPETGRRRTVWALIVVWRYSRHCFRVARHCGNDIIFRKHLAVCLEVCDEWHRRVGEDRDDDARGDGQVRKDAPGFRQLVQ